MNGKAVRLESAEDMAYQQVKLWYRVDSGKWKPYDIGLSEELETEDLDIFEAEDDDFFFTEGNNVPAAGVMDRVQFKLTDKEGERVYASVTVPVVRDEEAAASATKATANQRIRTRRPRRRQVTSGLASTAIRQFLPTF